MCVALSAERRVQQGGQLDVTGLNAPNIGLGQIEKRLAFQLAVACGHIDPAFRPDQRTVRPGQGHRVQRHLQCASLREFAFQIDRRADLAGARDQHEAPIGNLHRWQSAATFPARTAAAEAFKPVKANAAIIQCAAQFRRRDRHSPKRRDQALPGEVCRHVFRPEGHMLAGFDPDTGNHRAAGPEALDIRFADQGLLVAPLGKGLMGNVLPSQPGEGYKQEDQGQDRNQQPPPPFQAPPARLRAFNL